MGDLELEQRFAKIDKRLDTIEQHLESLQVNSDQLQHRTRDHEQRFDTLQTSLVRRLLFRLDGWPGQRNLNADGRAWRPWHRTVR